MSSRKSVSGNVLGIGTLGVAIVLTLIALTQMGRGGEVLAVAAPLPTATVATAPISEPKPVPVTQQISVAESVMNDTATVVVKSGDTLWGLLRDELDRDPTWDEVVSSSEANGLQVEYRDGGIYVLIVPGQELTFSISTS